MSNVIVKKTVIMSVLKSTAANLTAALDAAESFETDTGFEPALQKVRIAQFAVNERIKFLEVSDEGTADFMATAHFSMNSARDAIDAMGDLLSL